MRFHRLAYTALLCAAAIAWPAYAQYAPPQDTRAATTVKSAPQEPDEQALLAHGHYRNKQGEEVHSPAKTKSGQAPAGASARCADGTFSFSRSRRGTCSHHGGVASWL